MSRWSAFWSDPPDAFGPARAEQEHPSVAAAVVAALELQPGQHLLDWGCGHARGSRVYAAAGLRVSLHEPSPALRRSAAAHCAGRPGVDLIERTEDLSPGSLDAVVVFSVVQYLTEAELAALLQEARRCLRPGGALVLGDVIHRGGGDLATFFARPRSLRHLGQRVREGVRLAASGYLGARRAQPLRRFEPQRVASRLRAAGFDDVRRLPQNLGPHPRRASWLAR